MSIIQITGQYTVPYMPVGSYWCTTTSTSPGTLFGGTWTQLKEKFLYITNTTPATGGANTHTLSVAEMPSHNHSMAMQRSDGSGSVSNAPESFTYAAATTSAVTYSNTGGSGAHENKPPYLAVNVWYRTS